MTDVKTSNARRIGFTAMALVSFWIVAWQAYWVGAKWTIQGMTSNEVVWACRVPLVGLTCALLPTLFLALSIGNTSPRFPTGLIFWAMLLMGVGGVVVYGVGELDSSAHGELLQRFGSIDQDDDPRHHSWISILPIILTTAFVIFGAWRSAVRDADVDAVGEDEV